MAAPKACAVSVAQHEHHLATNKSKTFTALLEAIFKPAGMQLKDAENRMMMDALQHTGRHSNAYHRWVLESLRGAVAGKSGAAYSAALRAELARIREILKADPGKLRRE